MLPGQVGYKLGCQLDRVLTSLIRATLNVGAMFARQVEGRVSTEVQALQRLCSNMAKTGRTSLPCRWTPEPAAVM